MLLKWKYYSLKKKWHHAIPTSDLVQMRHNSIWLKAESVVFKADTADPWTWELVRGDDLLCGWNLHITDNWPTSLHPWIQPTSDLIVSIHVVYMVEKKFVYKWTCTVHTQVVQRSTIIIWSGKALMIVYSWHVI